MSMIVSICYRPPPNLLRQETEGTQIYLAVLNKAASEIDDETRATEIVEQPLYDTEVASKGGDQKLREEAERQLVSFCGHILKEVATLQPAPSEAVQADFHCALALRSPVTVQVLGHTNMLSKMSFILCLSELSGARPSIFRPEAVVLMSSPIFTSDLLSNEWLWPCPNSGDADKWRNVLCRC
jgi:hypothetical protein